MLKLMSSSSKQRHSLPDLILGLPAFDLEDPGPLLGLFAWSEMKSWALAVIGRISCRSSVAIMMNGIWFWMPCIKASHVW